MQLRSSGFKIARAFGRARSAPWESPTARLLPRLILGLCFLAQGLIPGLTLAQGLAGKPIREIRYEGLDSLAPETLDFYLEIAAGKVYDPTALNRKIHDLWDKKLVDDIATEASAVDGGVLLVVSVRERAILRSVEYVGLKRVSRSDIADRIARDNVRVREGDPLNLGELNRLKALIEDLYKEKGYRLAEAVYELETVSGTERRATYTIDEGDKIRISEIDFEGNTVFSDRLLKLSMRKTKESGPIARVFKKDVYKPATLEEDLEKVRKRYKKAGYKNVVVGDPKAEVKATRPDATDPDKQRRRLVVTVPLEEGNRWRLGEIRVEGAEKFEPELLRAQFPKPNGGWLRSTIIEEGVETINNVYQNSGHIYARVDTEIEEVTEDTADLVVKVTEGDRYTVGRIEFEGNRKTRDKVLRRSMGLQESMVMNSGALKNSLLRIRQLEYFTVDDNDPVQIDVDNEDKTVDLTVKGAEGDRTEMQFGAGFSELDGFFGTFSFRTRNFMGRGETLGVSVQSGGRQDVLDLSYFVPWFLDRPQSVGIQLFLRELDFDFLVGQRIRQETKGGTLTYGRNLGLFRNLSLSYSLFDSLDQQQIDGVSGPIDLTTDRRVSSLRLSHSFDRRDSRFEPTRGRSYNIGLEYAGDFLGGDTDFIRPRAGFNIYLPVTREGLHTVAGLNVEAGYIEALGDRPLFSLDRFFLGGENSIRGFQPRTLWVRDKDGNTVLDEFGRPLGGETFLQMNLEYHFVLGGPFRLLAFADFGGVFAKDQSFDYSLMRHSLGVELRVLVPIFGAPLRFIYALNPDEYPDDRFRKFQFSIGTTF
ncbi:MAG: outer membrane protein assembly factor BamA [bacterium]|nr:outer membrane protein assembly factor BamA [bacterium]